MSVIGDRAAQVRERWRRTLTVIRAPRVRIEIFGSDRARRVHRSYTARHPRFKVTAAKKWGVAVMRLPASFDKYLADCSRLVRRRRTHAEKAGFRYAVVSPQAHLDEILAINQSAPIRQGRAMDRHYVDRDQVARAFEGRAAIHGVLNTDGQLRAYAHVIDIGDAFTFTLLIGHADDLDEGVMYLLVTEVIRACIDERRADGSPKWLVCDTFWGATRGLAYFKERVGFEPYTVDWAWVDRAI